MRRLHLVVGVCAVVAFLITGQFMRHHSPPMTTLSDSARLMYRSRHIYILAVGLLNLVLGVHYQQHREGWRRAVQTIGSGFLFASPIFLILAFVFEPARGFNEEMPWSHAGLYALFGGCMLHFVCGAVTSEKRPAETRPLSKEQKP